MIVTSRTRTAHFLLPLLAVILIAFGCKSTETATDRDEVSADADTAMVEAGEVSALQDMLNTYRSRLSDVYASQQHDMPDAYLKKGSSDEPLNRDPYDGYRVQILSTRELKVADSLASSFRIWSDTTITGYNPPAYVSFRQPYFKVHIGDFQQRDQANRFSQLLKKKFPDAWVVHDRINPNEVPADTATFSFENPSERKKKQNGGESKPAADSASVDTGMMPNG